MTGRSAMLGLLLSASLGDAPMAQSPPDRPAAAHQRGVSLHVAGLYEALVRLDANRNGLLDTPELDVLIGRVASGAQSIGVLGTGLAGDPPVVAIRSAAAILYAAGALADRNRDRRLDASEIQVFETVFAAMPTDRRSSR